jgi:hypothetical protein
MSKPSVLAVAYRLAPSIKSAILLELNDILKLTKVELETEARLFPASSSGWIERYDKV